MDNKIQVFENKKIRTAWNEETEEWYFSVVDVVSVLTDSKDPTAYWRKLKQRLKAEGNETVTNCHGLKMTAPDGKKTNDRRCRYDESVKTYPINTIAKGGTF